MRCYICDSDLNVKEERRSDLQTDKLTKRPICPKCLRIAKETFLAMGATTLAKDVETPCTAILEPSRGILDMVGGTSSDLLGPTTAELDKEEEVTLLTDEEVKKLFENNA